VARHQIRRWEDYSLDGTGTGVLRNLPGITNERELARFETDITQARMAQLLLEPVDGHFDYAHMREIHRRIFQDVYEWAGQTRVGPHSPRRMSKTSLDVSGGPGVTPGPGTAVYHYYPADFLEEPLEKQYRELAAADLLVGLDVSSFVEALAVHWSDINVLHAFREGNTRSQFAFFHQLAENAGYDLSSHLFKDGAPLRDEFVNARFYAHLHDTSWFATVLARAIVPLDRGGGVGRSTEGDGPAAPTGVQGRRSAGTAGAGEFTEKQQSAPEVRLLPGQ